MKKKTLSMNEIAAVCDVSVSTVSRVLNNAPGISRDTRRKVMEAVRDGAFVPRPRRRPIARGRIRLVIAIPDSQQIELNPFFDSGELLNSINSAFQKEKKQVEVVTYSRMEEWFQQRESEVDGLIIAFGEAPSRVKERLVSRKIPYIYLNRNPVGENYISCNNIRGTMELGTLLISRGYRRIGYLGYSDHPINPDRVRGYRIAMSEGDIRGYEQLIHHVGHIEEIDSAAAEFFSAKKCDAVMAFNDTFAIRLINAFGAAGKRVPRDIAVTGFDDSPLRKLFSPAVTTVSLSIYEMGFMAARWLRDNILNRESRSIRLEIDGRLIEGETVKGTGV